MSFNRLPYDKCAYQHALYETISPGEYVLDRNNSCKPCFVPDPSIRIQRSGDAICSKDLIDVDSELLGITRRASLCPNKKYIPSKKDFCKADQLPECNALAAEPTRLSLPPCTNRCVGINRWEWLCKNEQNQVEIPFEYGIQSRVVTRDMHRPCIPHPISQTMALPNPKEQSPPLFCGNPREVHPNNYRSCSEIKQY